LITSGFPVIQAESSRGVQSGSLFPLIQNYVPPLFENELPRL
jgi:hypothetical protein